jgi:hypothetical protein
MEWLENNVQLQIFLCNCLEFCYALKGLSYEIDFENVDENGQILA